MQDPMVFDLSEHSDKTDDYIFGKPKWLSTMNKKSKKKRKNNKNNESDALNQTNKEFRSRKTSMVDSKNDNKKGKMPQRPRTVVNGKRMAQPVEGRNTGLSTVQKQSKQTKAESIMSQDTKKASKSKATQNKEDSKHKKIDFYHQNQNKGNEEELEDEGVMILQLTKKGNEFMRPVSKPQKKEIVNSYTDQVLQKLDEIQHPKSKGAKKTGNKALHKTEAKINLEGLELKGMEIIKDLDEYYEKNKVNIVNKVMKSKKFKDFAKINFEKEEVDDFNTFKREITKHVIKDLEKYCLIR